MSDKFFLGQYFLGKPGRIEITEEEYVKVGASFDALRHIRDVEEKYIATIENYFELELALLEEALRFMILARQGSIDAQHPRNVMSRRIINFLSSVRLYLDSLPQHAQAILKGSSLDSVRRAPSVAYDKSLAYRVMEALRNYSQHQAFPVHSWETASEWDNRSQPPQCTIEIQEERFGRT